MSTTKMLETVVVKFGGSVLDNEKAIDQVASAMKGVTAQIMALSKKDNPEIEPHLLDELLSSGEKTSARLVAAALASFGLQSVIVDPDTPYWPVITDERHLDANPLVGESRAKTKELILPLLVAG